MLCAGAAGAIAIASLGTAGTANATCAAAGHQSVGQGCEAHQVGDVAIALGPGSTAISNGGFNVSIAIGSQARATAGGGRFNSAVAIGRPGQNNALNEVAPATAETYGVFSRSYALGDGTLARAGTDSIGNPGAQINNTSLAIGKGSTAIALALSGNLGHHVAVATRGRSARNGVNNGI